jgi:hypothetical protein
LKKMSDTQIVVEGQLSKLSVKKGLCSISRTCGPLDICPLNLEDKFH